MTRSVFILILFVASFGELTNGSYIPLTAVVRTDLGLDQEQIQSTIAGFLFGFAVSQLFLGPMSDRFGRRPIFLGGITFFLAGSLLGALSTAAESLVLARVLQGVGAAAGHVTSRPILGDVSDEETLPKRMSMMMLAFAVVVISAPSLGALFVLMEDWRFSFVVLSGVGGLAFLWAAKALPETNVATGSSIGNSFFSDVLQGYGELFVHRRFLGIILTHSFAYGCLYILLSSFPLMSIDVFDISPSSVGGYMTLTMTGLVVGLFLAKKIVPRIGMEKCMVLGSSMIGLSAILTFALAITGTISLLSFLGVQLILVVGGGLLAPNTTALSLIVVPNRSGFASAGLGFLSMAVAAFGVWLVGLVYDGTPLSVTILQVSFAACSLISLFAAACSHKSTPSPNPNPL
ncbi:MFS transporter [Roseobacteraceae bacterium S113]